MPQEHPEEADHKGASAPDRARLIGVTGAEGDGSVGESASGSAAPTILTVDNLRHIGRTLNGAHWQADIATLVGCSKSQMTRFLNGQRDLNPLLSPHLQYVIAERIVALIELLNVEGMPYAGSPEAQTAIRKVKAAVSKVPGQEPPRDR